MTARDSLGQPLETFVLQHLDGPENGLANQDLLIFGSAGIATIDFVFTISSANNDGIGIDDLSFTIAARQPPVNNPPVAVAGLDETVHPGTPVTLDGSGSFDLDGNVPLSFSWTITSAPAGSAALESPPRTFSRCALMDDESIVNVFLRRYLADLQQGKLRTRHEYEALYPGREELIATEYERLHLAAADTEHLDKLRRVRAPSDLGDDGSIVA